MTTKPTKQDALRLSHIMREIRELKIAGNNGNYPELLGTGMNDRANELSKEFYDELGQLEPHWSEDTLIKLDDLLYRQDAFDTWVSELPLATRAALVEHSNLSKGWLTNND